MKKIIFSFLSLFAYMLCSVEASYAQKPSEPYSAQEIAAYKEQSRRLVNFFQFTLNTIGDEEALPSEKQTIIYESFSKFFRDEKVQIEDDLDERRVVPTNKDVQAYLKDVDFFFKKVRFDFSVQEVTHFINDAGELSFSVKCTRNLRGTTLDGKEVNNAQPRFIEINLNKAKKDLKIVSVYTTRLSLAEELSSWWNALPAEWRSELANLIGNPSVNSALKMADVATLKDTLTTDSQANKYGGGNLMLEHLVQLTNIELANFANKTVIDDVDPLSKLSNLKEVNLAGTKVNSLLPLRNLTKLKIINFSNTPIASIEPLKYAISLEEIYCANTPALSDLSPLENFENLQILHCQNNTAIADISSLATLKNLEELNLDNTMVSNLVPLRTLKSLKTLKLSNTQIKSLDELKDLSSLERLEVKGNWAIKDLAPLSGLTSLRLLFIDNTNVSSLAPLKSLPQISTVYCDGAKVSKTEAKSFMQAHPNCLVVYETGALEDWWASLPDAWKELFRNVRNFSGQPDKEKLHEVSKLQKLDISNNGKISALTPLSVLFNLEELRCENTNIINLQPLQDLSNLRELNLSKTNVTDLSPLRNLKNLQVLHISNTQVANLEPLKNLSRLKTIHGDYSRVYDLLLLRTLNNLEVAYFDHTPVEEAKVNLLYEHNPTCLVVFRTEDLQAWWRRLPNEWKSVLQKQGFAVDAEPTREQLHQLTKIEDLDITGESSIKSLAGIEFLSRLKRLKMGSTGVADIAPLVGLSSLELLAMPKNFVRDISAVSRLRNLQTLDIEGTPVESLGALANLRKLTTLNIASTSVSDLKPLENIKTLRHLACYGTGVRNLKPVEGLKLSTLKCYNTRISAGKVNRFRNLNPKCEVVF